MPENILDNIFVKKVTATSLEQFARSVFQHLGFGNIEEHRSANYWGEQYFMAFAGDISLTIAAADDSGFEDYDYWICVEGTERAQYKEIRLAMD